MQSSVGLAFRAVVMLACLAAVPLLGTYGKQLPRLYQAAVDAYNKTRGHADAADGNRPDAREDAPPFAPAGMNPAVGSPDPLTKQPSQWPAPGPDARPLSDWRQPGSPPTTAAGPMQRASFNAPLAHTDPDSPDKIASASHSAATGSASAPDSCTAQFRQIERRLRELGATYYLLETWGTQGDRYRFLCHMAIAGNTDDGRNRIFQAADSDPLGAMQNVLQQVEDWRGGRQP